MKLPSGQRSISAIDALVVLPSGQQSTNFVHEVVMFPGGEQSILSNVTEMVIEEMVIEQCYGDQSLSNVEQCGCYPGGNCQRGQSTHDGQNLSNVVLPSACRAQRSPLALSGALPPAPSQHWLLTRVTAAGR